MIKNEAVELLSKSRLVDILNNYGKVWVQGSYYLDLMTWRDIDISIAMNNFSVNKYFEMGGILAKALNPYKMHFRNEIIAQTKGLPKGYYWGIYLIENDNEWKIDIWAMNYDEYKQGKIFTNKILERLTNENRRIITEIKTDASKRQRYRKDYLSVDIYEAVLDPGVRNKNDFIEYLLDKGIEY